MAISANDAAKLQQFFDENEIELTGLNGKLTAKHLKAFERKITYRYGDRNVTLSGPIFERVDDNTFQIYAVYEVGEKVLVKRVWELKWSNGQITLITRTNDFYKKNQNPAADFENRYNELPIKLIVEAYKWAK